MPTPQATENPLVPCVLGIDIGSTTSKCVVLDAKGAVASTSIIAIGAGSTGPTRAFEEALAGARLSANGLACIVATGYGRATFSQANAQKSELSCHAKGAHAMFPEAHTIIDIGGQDAKVLRLADSGQLLDFAMNDKCAAGTGRFLDVMASVLELDISQLAEVGAQSAKPAHISSTCTVFAESEVISQLAAGTPKADIVAGIHDSVAQRAAGLAKRGGIVPAVAMTGGVARNAGVVRAIEALIGEQIITSEFAQLAGAYGAALYAAEQLE